MSLVPSYGGGLKKHYSSQCPDHLMFYLSLTPCQDEIASVDYVLLALMFYQLILHPLMHLDLMIRVLISDEEYTEVGTILYRGTI